MSDQIKNRIKSFIWRAGLFSGVAIASYLMNIADIREIEAYKLATILVVTLATYVANEGTKYLNRQ